jgi:hypothetical protein
VLAEWGEINTFGRFYSGLSPGIGSRSTTSSAAPRSWPLSSASISPGVGR